MRKRMGRALMWSVLTGKGYTICHHQMCDRALPPRFGFHRQTGPSGVLVKSLRGPSTYTNSLWQKEFVLSHYFTDDFVNLSISLCVCKNPICSLKV